jgi:hypothetical protein
MSRFVRDVDYSSLSAPDLLQARDLYHVHLANLENVVATAIGRYRIRFNDPDYQSPYGNENYEDSTARRLDNSGVRKWSWPCVMVFVSNWVPQETISRKPAQLIPPRLYLPDGRVVPTCVIHAPRQLEGPPPLQDLAMSPALIGGGYPVLTEDQGQQRVGSVGCLVSDGSYIYALTSRHVVGETGTPAFIFRGGDRHPIATSHGRAEGKLNMQDVYPGWPGIRSLINIDAGLFRVSDISEWTAQVLGIGRVGDVIDLNIDTLNLDLIGCPVRAYGGVSGQLRGEIQGLFYRYRSVGGSDYVADLLIGPRKEDTTVTTRPGDSGTLWFWDAEADRPVPINTPPAKLRPEQAVTAPHEPAVEIDAPIDPQGPFKTAELRPIALQWGGHSFLEPGGQGVVQFALASSLSNVCRLLDVELVRDWNIDHSLYWGRVGHYKIAFSACLSVTNPNLATLLAANADNISVTDEDIKNGNMLSGSGTGFVALADVPDLVWRNTRPKDKGNHFADMDQPGGPNEDQPTLMQLWESDESSRTPAGWTAFYNSLQPHVTDPNRGALPFRVRQIYSAMIKALINHDINSYVCGAGVLAHYVGDACQPLHVSRFHHGHPGKGEDGVHSFYETHMLDQFAADVVAKVNARLGNQKATASFEGGDGAARRVVQLMKDTITQLDPEHVVNVWIETAGSQHAKNLWTAVGDDTAACMVLGVLCLADIWESAWVEGQGDTNIDPAALAKVKPSDLIALYTQKTFVEAMWLKDMS